MSGPEPTPRQQGGGTGPGRASRPGGGTRRTRPWFGLAVREARGDVPLLVCLALLVAVLTGLSALVPTLVAARQDTALRQRIATAQQAAPLITLGAAVVPPAFGTNDPSQLLTTGLAVAGPRLAADAAPALARSLHYSRSEVDYVFGQLTDGPAAPDPQIASSVGAFSYVSDGPSHVRMVAGAYPAAATRSRAPTPFAVSQATARLLGLRVGQPVSVFYASDDGVATTRMVLSGIYLPRLTGDSFWNDHAALDRPQRYPLQTSGQDQVSFHALIGADGPLHLADDGVPLPTLSWQLRVTPDRAAVAQAAQLPHALAGYGNALRRGQCQIADGDIDVGTAAEPSCFAGDWPVLAFTWTDGLSPVLDSFGLERRQADAVQSFALASVGSVLLATVFVAVRLLLRRREAQLRLQRARGASAAGLVLLRSVVATPLVALAAAAGWVVGERLGETGTSGSPQPLWAFGSAAAAWLLLPLLTWGAVREPAPRRRRPRRGRGGRGAGFGAGASFGRREVLEGTALLLAVAGVVSLRQRGAAPTQGVDLSMSAVPVLVAVVGVLLLLRVYPLLLRLLAARARRGRGVLAFVGLARAGRDATATGLAMFVLVLTLGTAVFGGMVARTVADGVTTGAAWSTGGDAVVTSGGNPVPTALPASSPVRAVGEQSRSLTLTADRDGTTLSGAVLITVDAARLAVAEPGSPLARALLSKASSAPLKRQDGSVEIPVLAGAALLAREPSGDLTAAAFTNTDRTHRVRLRPTAPLGTAPLQDPALGPLTSTLPPGTPLLVADIAAERFLAPQAAGGSAVLLYGHGSAALRSAGSTALGALAEVRLRADVLAAARNDGLVSELRRIYALSTVLTVGFGLLAVALELVLTARERGRTSSYLRTLGLGSRQAAALQLLQLLPFACAAAVGGVLLGVAEPRLLGPALNLRQFTGGPAQPALHTDYRLTAALGLGLALLVLGAAVLETLVSRWRRLGAVLRLGEI
ncbi:hypothetical protein ACEZCY_02140 [Streptacidiphilus sp. N1-12]|uniref:ABC transport system permease protein n=2 Tax=Streptacidiphilus alkalitolerans TaxID=3342712 RepID=A0ABV6V2Y3_9ACTN